MKAIGIFGGAFAPFHNGHLRLALEARARLGLSEVHLIPTAHPPHRPDSRVSAPRRLDWVRLAVRKERGLIADDREIQRAGPSYTVDTLTSLRQEFPQASLVLLMGADAFAHLHTWHRWSEIIGLAHLAVAARPGTQIAPSAECASQLASCRADKSGQLLTQPAGLWTPLDLPLLDISSTRVRRLLKSGVSVRGLVPDAILNSWTAADVAALVQDDNATTH